MVPFLALIVSFAAFRLAGWAGVEWLDGWGDALRPAVALMFLITASAHWGSKRADLIRMVPPSLPNSGFLVTLTGGLEIAGAVGLLLPGRLPELAAAGLFVMLIAMFPANVSAARRGLTLAGRPVTPIFPRTLMQIAFLAATAAAGLI